ncbi:helix-turn-helix domain-containing protein [Frankia sp. CH37]|nr:helix-turn-helix domain-containing protein [Parafrankia sp. CH37]
MARQQRPVDPSAGPVQEFAHDLRQLREKAGQPTYRVLAKSAGYSATTLSEAAGGARLPTLDVTLAFVGACNGDRGEWSDRWLATYKALQAEEPLPAADPEPPQPVDPPTPRQEADEPPDENSSGGPNGQPGGSGARLAPPPPQPPPPPPPPRSRLLILVAIGLVLVSVIGITVAVAIRSQSGSTDASRCPAVGKDALFTGTTYDNGANVRSGARLDRPLLTTVPPGCTIGFAGFCVGEKVLDPTAGIADTRWFALPHDGGFVASAIIHGNPPAGITAATCPDGYPIPTEISLELSGDPASPLTAVLQAHGPNAQIVGFAAYYAEDPASPSLRRWHQIGITSEASQAFSVSWRPDGLRLPPQAGDRVPVAAVACLGGGGPTEAVDFGTLRAAAPGISAELTASSGPPSAQDREDARRAACQYPH